MKLYTVIVMFFFCIGNEKRKKKKKRYLCMLRFWSRLIKMDDTRLPKKIFLQDCRQADSNGSQDIREVFKLLNLTSVYDSKIAVNVRYVNHN